VNIQNILNIRRLNYLMTYINRHFVCITIVTIEPFILQNTVKPP